MKPFRSSAILLFCLLSMVGCRNEAAEERREFQKLEAAIGLVANAGREDRGIRLEQLESVAVQYDRTAKLKSICVLSYRAFEKASGLLDQARKTTAAAESLVAEAERKKTEVGSLTPEEETTMITAGQLAADSLKAVTGELSNAERLVASCQEKRNHLRFELAATP